MNYDHVRSFDKLIKYPFLSPQKSCKYERMIYLESLWKILHITILPLYVEIFFGILHQLLKTYQLIVGL